MTRVICLQPALPAYRLDFFDRCFVLLDGGLTVHYSPADLHGLETGHDVQPAWSTRLGPLRDLLPGVRWQDGALSVQIRRGDVVVVAGEPRCLSNLVVLCWARLRGAHTIWWGHYWSSTSKPWRYALRLILMRLSHSVVFYTDSEVEECRRAMGRFAPVRMHGLNNGINVDTVLTCRVPYYAAERGRRLLFVGRITEKAQTALLLDALADPSLADVRLEVIGGGPEQGAMRERARNLGLDNRVSWHGVMTDEAAIANVANRCALFVYPGSVGLSLIHGMSYGLPSVVHANRWHHMPEIAALTPAETGFIFEEGNVASLTVALVNALSDPARLDRMSLRSIETIRDSFNTADMARRFVAAVRELSSGSV